MIVFTDNCDLVNGKYIKHRSYLLIKRLLLWAYYLKRSWRSKIFKRLTCCFGNAICCPSVTYNIGQCGKLSFDKSLKCVLDWWKWLELSGQKGAFTYIATVLMAHRIDDTTTTSALIHSNRRYEEDLHVFSLIWGQRIARLLMKFYSRSYKMADSKRIGK